jgi:hypothetical protein
MRCAVLAIDGSGVWRNSRDDGLYSDDAWVGCLGTNPPRGTYGCGRSVQNFPFRYGCPNWVTTRREMRPVIQMPSHPLDPRGR